MPSIYQLKMCMCEQPYLCNLPVWATSGKQNISVRIKPLHIKSTIHA